MPRIRVISYGLLLAVMAVLLTACPPRQVLAPPTITVDPTVTPATAELPGFDGVTPRPLASITDEKGNQADFVANELWLSTDDAQQLQDFLNRWQGVVLLEKKASDLGVSNLPTQYLVRVDVSAADTSKLSEDLRALDPNSRGSHRVSSAGALGLLAASASEAASGMKLGVNWVSQGQAVFLDRVTTEAASGPSISGTPYDPNPFTWPTHSMGSTQDIGVAEAWRFLEVAGKLGNKVKLAILDMGFSPDADTPSGWTAISNVPFKNPIGTANLLNCGGPCPWHGTNVMSAAMAVPDNAFGAAGAAGPIAKPVLVFTLYDFFTSIAALGKARVAGAKIANMSYSARVPAALSFSVLPFEVATVAFRASGMLLFAAAGNDGQNVDAEDCFIFCWEEAWHTPCENDGVICVGGLRWDSKNKAPGSNYGPEEVDIYAPYTMWLGPDPGAGGVQAKNGTSFSSPFAAGVAALIWAANPSLSAGQVENILFNTAHSSPDSRVNRYVNARDAVASALGDAPPFVEIIGPSDGSSFSRLGSNVFFTANAEDLEDGTPAVSWSSSRDGPIGTGTSFSRNDLSLGSHLITATASDSASHTTSDSVNITIVNDPPQVNIIRPTLTSFCTAESITFGANVIDINQSGATLPDGSVSWRVGSSAPFATGKEVTHSFTAAGTFTVTVKAIDDQGAFDEDSIAISTTVCTNNPPSVSITKPAADTGTGNLDFQYDGFDSVKGMWFKDVDLQGTATDVEDGTLSGASLVWTTDRSDIQSAALGTGNSLTVRLFSNVCTGVWHEVTLSATDSASNTRTALRRIFIWQIC